MLVKATHAGCRSFSLLICTYLHDMLAVHLFNAGLPCMASSRALARTQPVASVIHRLPCEAVHSASDLYVRTCHLFTREWGQGWYRVGPGLERVWNGMERGLERNGPLQHSCHHAAHLFINHAAHFYQNWQIGARVDCQLAGSWRAHLYHQTSQLCRSRQQL